MKFTIFTTQTCGACKTLKAYLAKFNKEYEAIDVTDDYTKRKELHEKYGAMTVPVLVREDGEFMVGFNAPKLMNMIK